MWKGESMTGNARMNDTAEAYDSVIRGIAIPKDRAPEKRGNARLPARVFKLER